jgi:hypothetical protein
MVVGQFGSFVKGFLLQYTEPIDDGDVIFLSDPYSCDGAVSHCNDWLVLTPIMAGEKKDNLLGWAAMFGHMTDVPPARFEPAISWPRARPADQEEIDTSHLAAGGRQGPVLDAQRCHDDLRGGHHHPARQAL